MLRDGRYLLVGKASDDQVLIQDPLSTRPILMSRAEFEAVWDGRLVLMARRAGLVDLSRRFNVSWFLGAIHKYRYLLGEVLAASFFLQLFALVSPLLRPRFASRSWVANQLKPRRGGPLLMHYEDWSAGALGAVSARQCTPRLIAIR